MVLENNMWLRDVIKKVKSQKFVTGMSKREETIIINSEFSIIGADSTKCSIIVKDNMVGVCEIIMLRLFSHIKTHLVLYCKACCSSRCAHTIFAFYSYEVGVMKAAFNFTDNIVLHLPEPIRKRLQETNTSFIIKYNLVPAVLMTVISIALLPFFTPPGDSNWYTVNEFMEHIQYNA